MTAKWAQWTAAFAAMSKREKQIVMLTLALAPLYLGYTYGIDPALIRARTAEASYARLTSEISTLRDQVAILAGGAHDPDAVNRSRIAKLSAQVAEEEARLSAKTGQLVPPERVRALLESLLAHHSGLELQNLRSLPAEPLEALQKVAAPADVANSVANNAASSASKGGDSVKSADAVKAVDAPALSGIYRHGIEIQVAGAYGDLLAWLEDVEGRPERLMWDRLDLAVVRYPRNVLTVRVYSVSLDPEWLRL